MNRFRLGVLGLCLAAIGGTAVPASAQSVPKVEVSGGYQFLNFSAEDAFSTEDVSESMPVGWYFDVAGNLTPMLGIVFQMGGNYKTFEESATFAGITATATADLKVHEFLGGVRLNLRFNSAIVPFGQVLVGAINGSVEVSASTTIPGAPPITFNEEDSSTNFGLQVGGGVNFGLTDAFGLGVGADYLRLFVDDAGANLFRFHAGVVIGR
jgi:opacity protein-like surface antigen